MLKPGAAILAVLATASFFASASEEKHSAANHWAFRAPRRPELPPDESASPPQSPVGRLVRARLHVEGLSPSPPADRYTLIRRLSLDLTGLPPAIEEVDAFVEALQRVLGMLR